MKSEVVSTSGFKVRPLSRVAKADSSAAEPQKSEIRSQRSEVLSSEPNAQHSRLRKLTEELRELEAKLRLGGGPDKIEKQHKAHKLTARERIDLLLDKDSYKQEIGLLVAYDEYKGGAPAAGVVTTIGRVNGREVVVVANDATVKAGSWWPETIKKILRAQEIAMRSHVPIIYLVDSAGVNLPYQGGVFPGQYGASRIFYYNSIMRRYLKIPQIS
ncbi:MAG TPA: carboxyl transferase domain-containing protein, partial [Pyrinomonadaceae bacterium]|nr:carboxyl transferase domain-containing protein [Pyrinomonadaceae bacterium]